MSKFSPIPDETSNALLKPAAESIGNSAGTIFDAAFNLILSPLKKYNIRKDYELKDYANKISTNISSIPENNRDPSKLNLVLKAVDDSKFRLDEEDMRTAFARLIAQGLDNRVNDNFYPAYSDILSSMSVKEAKLIRKIYSNYHHRVPTEETCAKNTHGSRRGLLAKTYLFDNFEDGTGELDIPIDLLQHSGLIRVYDNQWLTGDHYMTLYNSYEEKWRCANKTNVLNISSDETLEFIEGYVMFTDFGDSFANFIL